MEIRNKRRQSRRQASHRWTVIENNEENNYAVFGVCFCRVRVYVCARTQASLVAKVVNNLPEKQGTVV